MIKLNHKIVQDIIDNGIRKNYPCNVITEFGIPVPTHYTVDRDQALRQVLIRKGIFTEEEFEVFKEMYSTGEMPEDKRGTIDENMWDLIASKHAIYAIVKQKGIKLDQADIVKLQYGCRGFSDIKSKITKIISLEEFKNLYPWIAINSIEEIITTNIISESARNNHKVLDNLYAISKYIYNEIGKWIIFTTEDYDVSNWLDKYYDSIGTMSITRANYMAIVHNLLWPNEEVTSSHILLIVNNISMESDDEIADAYNTLIFNYSLETNGGTILSKDYICDENNIGLILSALVGRDFYERRYKELKLTNLNTTSIAAENQPITDFDCEMTEKLTKHNIVCMEDVSLHPRAYFKKMDLSDLEIDYLRLKLESNGLSFYDFDTYIKDLDDNDPHEIEIYDLYVADQINKDLYGVLNENYYYTVADLDYIAFDTLSPITMGNIGVLKNVINKYALHYVETTEELKQVIVNTAGRDLDVYVLFRYLHLDPESQSAVRSLWLKFTREFRGEAKELAYVSDLSLSVKEYTFIMQNKDYAPIAGLILYAQHEIPECFIGVDYANNDTPEEVPYDKECDAENSLIRVITGLLTPVGYDKIKEYVNGIVSDELSVSDKKILAAFITDFLYYMPDIKYITDISNSEKYSPTYSTITSYFKRMGNNHLNMTLDSIGDLIFASKPARRIMMMLLMKYVFTAKDQKNGDPFDMIK